MEASARGMDWTEALQSTRKKRNHAEVCKFATAESCPNCHHIDVAGWPTIHATNIKASVTQLPPRSIASHCLGLFFHSFASRRRRRGEAGKWGRGSEESEVIEVSRRELSREAPRRGQSRE